MKIPGGLLWWAFGTPIKEMIEAPMKGMMGELAVKIGTALALPPSVYRRYHNVTLPTAGGTTQIDHVFVSMFGVFVVETKNKSGWIFGSERDREWTQVFPGGRKYKFQNPLRQNYGHVRAMEEALAGIGLPRDVVKSVVIFIGDAELKREMPENVTVGLGGTRYIQSFRTRVLSESQVSEICAVIEAGRLKPSWGTSRQHVRNLRQRKDRSAWRPCPRCGRTMVLRTAKRGPGTGNQFWGCEGFPACRMVQNVE